MCSDSSVISLKLKSLPLSVGFLGTFHRQFTKEKLYDILNFGGDQAIFQLVLCDRNLKV